MRWIILAATAIVVSLIVFFLNTTFEDSNSRINQEAPTFKQKLVNNSSQSMKTAKSIAVPRFKILRDKDGIIKGENAFSKEYLDKKSVHYVKLGSLVPVFVTENDRALINEALSSFKWDSRWKGVKSFCKEVKVGSCELKDLALRIRRDGFSSSEYNKYLPLEYQIVINEQAHENELIKELDLIMNQMVSNLFYAKKFIEETTHAQNNVYKSHVLALFSKGWQLRFIGETRYEIEDMSFKDNITVSQVDSYVKSWPWNKRNYPNNNEEQLWQEAMKEYLFWLNGKDGLYNILTNDNVILCKMMAEKLIDGSFNVDPLSFPRLKNTKI